MLILNLITEMVERMYFDNVWSFRRYGTLVQNLPKYLTKRILILMKGVEETDRFRRKQASEILLYIDLAIDKKTHCRILVILCKSKPTEKKSSVLCDACLWQVWRHWQAAAFRSSAAGDLTFCNLELHVTHPDYTRWAMTRSGSSWKALVLSVLLKVTAECWQ